MRILITPDTRYWKWGFTTVRLGVGWTDSDHRQPGSECSAADNDPADFHQFQPPMRKFANLIRMLEILHFALFQDCCDLLLFHMSPLEHRLVAAQTISE
jgi:hypothetical protein